jgi:hypothetical protein
MKPRKGLLKKGDEVLVKVDGAEVRATVVRDQIPGRPVVLQTASGQMLSAFPEALTRSDR